MSRSQWKGGRPSRDYVRLQGVPCQRLKPSVGITQAWDTGFRANAGLTDLRGEQGSYVAVGLQPDGERVRDRNFLVQNALASKSATSSTSPQFRWQVVFLHHPPDEGLSLGDFRRSQRRARCRPFSRVWRHSRRFGCSRPSDELITSEAVFGPQTGFPLSLSLFP